MWHNPLEVITEVGEKTVVLHNWNPCTVNEYELPGENGYHSDHAEEEYSFHLNLEGQNDPAKMNDVYLNVIEVHNHE